MTETERRKLVETLTVMASRANMLARLYEDAAETVAGFDSEAAYQAEAQDAFAGAQESIDLAEMAQ